MKTSFHTSPAPCQFIGTLPFRSQQVDDSNANLDVSVCRSHENICESREQGNCDAQAGVYYGSKEDDVTKFCPRHFYEMHFAPQGPYRLVDADDVSQT